MAGKLFGKQTDRRGILFTLICLAVTLPPRAHAECLSLKVGTLIFDVQSCVQIQPEAAFDLTKDRFKFIADLDPQGKKNLLDSYRGFYVKGQVIKSQIDQKGVVKESGVLMGETIQAYVPPGAMQCAGIQGKRLSGKLVERCCDGNGDAPCLLDTGYVLQNLAVIGVSGSSAGDAQRQKAKKSKDYQTADKHFRSKDWKKATIAFEKARSNGELDIAGHFKLGYSYRMLDLCPAAISPLQYIHSQREKGATWADEDAVVRAGEFLLARCYAKMNQPGASVLLLNAYLLEPQKYAKELRDSLSHVDFGWIHTSREYRDYQKEARKKLSGIKSQP
jgi:hypothetical protein